MEDKNEKKNIGGKLFLWPFLILISVGIGIAIGYGKGYNIVKNQSDDTEKVYAVTGSLENYLVKVCLYSEAQQYQRLNCDYLLTYLSKDLRNYSVISKSEKDSYIERLGKKIEQQRKLSIR
ncbi:hypothetical protein [Salinicola sp. MIT1003]|jgi:hypothetical protein|uniref:hypothetical protein n=1 Tax=Salinicola sp. MIT1003 TaxID=1882734 RepID=UPI001114C0AB|nr:hypothetical protein [Salinicola sp. MIT1003]